MLGGNLGSLLYGDVSVMFGYENISMTILPLPLIQEEQLSVNGKRMYTKYW